MNGIDHPCDKDFDDSWNALVWPDTLGQNLAVAAALCRSFELGHSYARDVYWNETKYSWFPGFGRSAP